MEHTLFAFIPLSQPIFLDQVCPMGWKKIRTSMDLQDGLFSVLTLNLMTAWRVELECYHQLEPQELSARMESQ